MSGDIVYNIWADPSAAVELDRLQTENERLRRWKAEATEVLARWDAVADLVPSRFGYRRSAAVVAEIERLRADLAAERALADQLHNALCLVAVNLSGPKTAAAVAAHAAARTNGSAGATDVGAQP